MRAVRNHFVALFVLCVVLHSALGYYCPPGCSCLQRSVRCIRARLTVIPRVPQDTNVLDLRFNHFEEIPENAFEGLSQVHTLFLNENEIGFLHENALDGLVALRFLYLNNNRISRLPEKLFKKLKHLEAIYIENNDIWQINTKTFANLPRLNRLFMFNNKITNIPSGTFANLPSLKRLRLDGNPIDCDCGVYSLWQHHQRHPQRNLITITMTCETPTELYRRGFAGLQERNFHCKKPEILLAPHDMHPTTGDTIELPCQMTGDPSPEIIWMQNTNEISPDFSERMQVLATGSLKISDVEANDIGIYECIGRNEMGETKSPPVRMIVEAMTTLQHHNNQLEQLGQPQQQLQHQQQQQPLQPLNNWSHRQSPSLQRVNVVSGGAGAALPLDQPPRFTHTPVDRIVALDGAAVMLDCMAIGSPQPEIQWYHNGRLVTQSTQTIRIQSNGSLIITQPTLLTAGNYKCEATNHLGSIVSSARIDVREFPEILMAPQNQTVKIGKPFILECDADGNPIPTITWKFNGTALLTNERITLENENTELIVSAALETDSGVYTCQATNENGMSEVEATITVERIQGPPKIIIEPYALEAFSGTTIELPCKAEEDEGVQITWRRDGRLIDPNTALTEKYQISGSGSLYVKNVTIFDGGRYECSLKNEYGRATASALITIKDIVNLAPGDRYVRIAFAEAAKEIDLAINNTVDTLFSNRTRPTANGAAAPPNYAQLLRVFRFPTGEARQLARAAEIYERTLVNIRKHVARGDNLTMTSDAYEFRELLSREHLQLVAELSGCMAPREQPNCTDMCYHAKYRSIDGTCNNLRHPTWGASLTAFRRLAPPIYENGFSQPIGWTREKLYAGFAKPSARLVSSELIATAEITPDDTITHMVMQWGQFLDHDLDHAIPSVSAESWDGIDCKKSCEQAPPCYPIEVPPHDARIRNRRCIDLVRSSAICGSGQTSVFFESVQHREQINQLTSYIDGSQIYGYSYEFAQELRNLTTDDGLMRVGVQFPQQKRMLPFAAPQDGMDCRRNLDENNMNCFTAGDIRVNEQLGLLAMHTLWMREHNRLAEQLRVLNPHWDGDTLYQEARKIVGAQLQHITYKQWLPLIVGASGMQQLGDYNGYNAQLNPSIANEFATAALRFGHTIINPLLQRLNSSFQPIAQGHLPLHKAFFAPWRLAYEGGVDPLLRGLFAAPAKLKMPQQNLNLELTEKLFHATHAVALDLAAINIQRGRDHGIPGYNVYRAFCNLSVAQSFDELQPQISDAEARRKLEQLYGHPDNIDVWVGGVLEDQVSDGKVGPLFQCLLVEQMRRLRDGDRFWYEREGVFLPQQLQQLRQANLARVLCDNGDNIAEVSENVFVLPKKQQQPNGGGDWQQCADIEGINLYFWQDCGSCNSLSPLLETFVPQTYVKRASRQKRAIAQELPELSDNNNDNDVEICDEVNEERISGLEEVISSFQKELKKMHKKLHKLEESCVSSETQSSANSVDAATGASAITKPKRNHCVDAAGTTRLFNEVWTPDACTRCECRHAQITCTREKCADAECGEGEVLLTPPEACCAHCVKVATTQKSQQKH